MVEDAVELEAEGGNDEDDVLDDDMTWSSSLLFFFREGFLHLRVRDGRLLEVFKWSADSAAAAAADGTCDCLSSSGEDLENL